VRPTFTLTTDFGLADAYVAQMKAVLLRLLPDAGVIDVTHLVPRQDVLAGSLALERAVFAFEAGTVHVGVVDPGVGTGRRLLATRVREQWVLCPDNGMITWTIRRWGGRVHALTWRPPHASDVFHGRDILAPAAAKLAAGEAIESLASPIDDPLLFDLEPAPPGATSGRIIHVDHFGNCTTNLLADRLPPRARVQAGLHAVGPVRRTYGDVKPGEPLALIGSSDLLEIAVRNASAASQLGLAVGSIVQLRA
jgi:S-adenosylmethionine hydrolase